MDNEHIVYHPSDGLASYQAEAQANAKRFAGELLDVAADKARASVSTDTGDTTYAKNVRTGGRVPGR